MILNMLVSIMGETLGEVKANKEEAALSQRIQILDDFIDVFLVMNKFKMFSAEGKNFFEIEPCKKYIFKASLINVNTEATVEEKIDEIENVIERSNEKYCQAALMEQLQNGVLDSTELIYQLQ